MLEIVKAKYHNGYKIWVEFNNGRKGVVDFSDILWGEMFESLKDLSIFRNFSISEALGALILANGAIILPHYLLSNLVG